MRMNTHTHARAHSLSLSLSFSLSLSHTHTHTQMDLFDMPPESEKISLSNKFSTDDKVLLDVAQVYCDEFVITAQFKEVVRKLNDEEELKKEKKSKFVLKGPKGVGKSVTLGALACICTRSTFVYSTHSSEALVIEPPPPMNEGSQPPQSKKIKLGGGE